MGIIYITGHKNPDLDSVCSAYGYAALMNLQEPNNTYIPIRCGHLSDNTRNILEQLDIEIPAYKRDVFPKVRDVMLTDDYGIQADDPLTAAASVYEHNTPSAIPVFDQKEFYGLLTVDDIAGWTMSQLSKTSRITEIPKVRDIMRQQDLCIDVDEFFL